MEAPLSTVGVRSRSRGAVRELYFLMTPENMVQNQLPHLTGAVVKVLGTPRGRPARFGQYLIEWSEGGGTTSMTSAEFEDFFYVLDGQARIRFGETTTELRPDGYAYVPSGVGCEFDASAATRLLWLKRRYEPVPGLPLPEAVVGRRADVPENPGKVAGMRNQHLLPDDARYDLAMNIIILDPGTCFPLVEIHHQEHGLYMLAGQGIYYLGEESHEVKADDYIYMAPYCPQYYYALGSSVSAYLLYKDVNRDGF